MKELRKKSEEFLVIKGNSPPKFFQFPENSFQMFSCLSFIVKSEKNSHDLLRNFYGKFPSITKISTVYWFDRVESFSSFSASIILNLSANASDLLKVHSFNSFKAANALDFQTLQYFDYFGFTSVACFQS